MGTNAFIYASEKPNYPIGHSNNRGDPLWLGAIYPKCTLLVMLLPFHFLACDVTYKGFLGSLDDQDFAYNNGDPGLTSESGRSPGEGNGYPLQYSCLENSMDRGAWQALDHGVTYRRI